MPFGHIDSAITKTAREMVDREKLFGQLESVYRTMAKEAALRNDKEADDIGNAAIDELDPEMMRKVVRAWLGGDSAEAFNLFCGCMTRAYNKHVERHAEQALEDVAEHEARGHAEAMDRRIYG